MKKTGLLLFLLAAGLVFMGCPQPVDPNPAAEAPAVETPASETPAADTTLDDAKEFDFATDLEKFGQDTDANWFSGYDPAFTDGGTHIIPGAFSMTSLTVAKESTDGADQVAEFDFIAKDGTDASGAAISFDASSMIKIDLGTSRFQWDSDNYGNSQDFFGKTVSLRMNVPQGYIDAGLEIKMFLKDTAWSSYYPETPLTLTAGWQTYTMDLTSVTGPDLTLIDILGLNIAIDGTITTIDLDALVALSPIQIDWINWE